MTDLDRRLARLEEENRVLKEAIVTLVQLDIDWAGIVSATLRNDREEMSRAGDVVVERAIELYRAIGRDDLVAQAVGSDER